jgi:hypothetical protein
LNHLTVPVAILRLQDAQKRAVPARPSRRLDPISAMSWGGGAVSARSTRQTIIRMSNVYADQSKIASENEIQPVGRSSGHRPNASALRQ